VRSIVAVSGNAYHFLLFLLQREETKQKERLLQGQNLREVAERVTVQQATGQAKEEEEEEEEDKAVIEDGNGRNVVAKLDEEQDEESPLQSDTGGQREQLTVEVGAPQPMATGPSMTIPKRNEKGKKKPRGRSRDKQAGIRNIEEAKPKPSRKQPSDSFSQSTLFQKKHSHSPPISQSNPATAVATQGMV
jgi:hypothetical protein